MAKYNRSYLVENTTSDNRSRARKYMRKESGMSKDESMQLDHQLQTQFKNVGKCECKFMLGLTRMYMNGELEGTIGEEPNEKSIASIVNQCLGIVTEEPYASQFDYNLNGMTAMQFIEAFQDKVEAAGEADKENLSKQDFGGNNGYDIVLIDSFEKAKEYAKYTDWCVTEDYSAFINYTKGGVFYFCLKDDFEDVPMEEGDNAPLDAYGLSMIAVSIYPDGKCNTITCRWNHENGGNDNIMTTEELSKVIGENFYDVFKPVSRTFIFGDKTYAIGVTEDGYEALFDERGKNILGDGVVKYGIYKKLSSDYGSDVLTVVFEDGMRNYLIYEDDELEYLFYGNVVYCKRDDKLSNMSDYSFYRVFVNEYYKTYLLMRNGEYSLLGNSWYEECKYDEEVSDYLNCTCFKVTNEYGYNIFNELNSYTEPIFKEDVYSYVYNIADPEIFGGFTFGVNTYGNWNLVVYEGYGEVSNYFFDGRFDSKDELVKAIDEYVNQQNESRVFDVGSLITEMIIKRLTTPTT